MKTTKTAQIIKLRRNEENGSTSTRNESAVLGKIKDRFIKTMIPYSQCFLIA
ncbi:hypothetical protein B0I27_11168 [Arcticibacter pallidicorallinus]|uniref:Uncharacterized protein n=1 Tax=Arcticibacter pallidicorallinus TaxID=1259464 RepID=A0A2T0TUY5_9SPHI|nr:hypothetical protein [Arcticibacter pallidicorallinus]PRY49512.1 hypothetical protein B0I27_11168 [Arcticibacter pallidicorallinus]